MSVFRIAVSLLLAGLATYVLVVHRSEMPGTAMTLLQNPEIWVAIGFVIIIAIFLSLRVPRIVGKMLDDRAQAIAHELDEAKRLREEAAALLAGYVQKAAQAENEAAAILADAKAEAERYAKETRAQLRDQIDRRAQMAKGKIVQAEAAALTEIRGLAADRAAAAAEKIITNRLDQCRSNALVEDSIKDLPDKLN
jgi:F-type H+-transporting ATPase subunit b